MRFEEHIFNHRHPTLASVYKGWASSIHLCNGTNNLPVMTEEAEAGEK